jgi:hypothetical protein
MSPAASALLTEPESDRHDTSTPLLIAFAVEAPTRFEPVSTVTICTSDAARVKIREFSVDGDEPKLGEYLIRAAQHQNREAAEGFREARPTDEELERDPLS